MDWFTASQGKLKAAKQKPKRTEYKDKVRKVMGKKEATVKDLKAKFSKGTGEKETAVNDLKAKVKDWTDCFTASHGKLKAAKKRQRTEKEAKISKVTGEKKTTVNDLKATKNDTVAGGIHVGGGGEETWLFLEGVCIITEATKGK